MKHPKVPSSMDYTDKCNGCGLCCIIREDNTKTFNFNDITDKHKDCKYLMRLDNSLSKCTIHGHHTGTLIKQDRELKWYCSDILEVPTLFEDCPYNDDKIKLFLTIKKE